MSRTPLKLRLLVLLPIVSAFLAVATLAMILIDRHIRFVDRPTFKAHYLGGVLTVGHTVPKDATGPSNATSSGPGPFYQYINEISQWQRALPRIDWSFLGIHYTSTPSFHTDRSNFVADRTRSFGVNAEFLLALTTGLVAATLVHYRRARRRYAEMAASYCPACGYDLRASPDRCPECGRPATPAQHAPTPPVQSPEPTSR